MSKEEGCGEVNPMYFGGSENSRGPIWLVRLATSSLSPQGSIAKDCAAWKVYRRQALNPQQTFSSSREEGLNAAIGDAEVTSSSNIYHNLSMQIVGIIETMTSLKFCLFSLY